MKKKGAMLYEIPEEIRIEKDTVCDLTGVRPEVLDRLLRQTAEKLVSDFMRGNVLKIYQHAIGQIELPLPTETPGVSRFDASPLSEALDTVVEEATEFDRVLRADGDLMGPEDDIHDGRSARPLPEPAIRRLPGESRADALKRVLEL